MDDLLPGTEVATLCGRNGCPTVSVSDDGVTFYILGPVRQGDGSFGDAEDVVAVPVALIRQAVAAVE